MAAHTHGPRLGGPSPTGFKVWCRADGAGTYTLETKLPTAATWTLQDTQAVETAKYNTAVLTATGLTASTKYDYRIKLDGTQVAAATTITMPVSSGRFVLYHSTDHHDDHATALAAILTDWTTNYESAGVPALIVITGDFYSYDSTPVSTTIAAAMTDKVLPAVVSLSGAGKVAERLPVLYTWDDHDFAGNNSSKDRSGGTAFSGEADAQVAAATIWDYVWRDQPRPASPSYGFSVDIAGVPIILTDGRSQRTPQTSTTPFNDGLNGRAGDFPKGTGTVWGTAQRDWLRAQLASYARRAMVIMASSTTLTSQRVEAPEIGMAGAPRDSVGIYFKNEAQHVLSALTDSGGDLPTLFVLSGDDHWSVVWTGAAGAGAHRDNDPQPGTPLLPLSWYEFKGNAGAEQGGAATTTSRNAFGDGDLFDNATDPYSNVRWDITTTHGGARASAHITYLDQNGAVLTSKDGSKVAVGTPGDFWFNNGVFSYWTTGIDTQKYPPNNSPAPKPVFGRAYIDAIHGTMHTRADIYRDYDGRLRNIADQEPEPEDRHRRPLRPTNPDPEIW